LSESRASAADKGNRRVGEVDISIDPCDAHYDLYDIHDDVIDLLKAEWSKLIKEVERDAATTLLRLRDPEAWSGFN